MADDIFLSLQICFNLVIVGCHKIQFGESGKRSRLNRVPAVSYLRAKLILVLSNYACAASLLPTG